MLHIRPATNADAAAISALTTELSRKFIAPDCSEEGSTHLLNSMDLSATLHRLEQGFDYLVACDGERLVGVAAMRDNRHLYHLFVAESHQRQGLGRQLWETAQAACLAVARPPQFTVNSSRGSRQVYEAFGFVGEAEVVLNGVPFIPMTLRLDPP